MLDGFMDQIVQDQNFGVSSATINAIKSDPSQVAFYLNALAYGGYTLSNVASDLKRKQAVANGDTSLANVVVLVLTKTSLLIIIPRLVMPPIAILLSNPLLIWVTWIWDY